jgi:thiamine biosynthesis lipoprotein
MLAGTTMGTTWSLRFDNARMFPLDAVRQPVEAALQRVVAQMSTWEPGSDISRFNCAASGSRQVLEPEFAEVLACALQWAGASGGAIDPTIGPLVALWGFGAQAHNSGKQPSPAALAAARARVGWQRLTLERTPDAIVQPGGLSLDLSGVAKGYAVDHLTRVLRALGLCNFVVEVGGELRAVGLHPDRRAWQVQIDAADGVAHRLALTDMAIATSGDRWHVREHEGRRWSHTIDPRCGEPTRHALVSATVLHPECMHADGLATVLAVLGPDDGLAFAEEHRLTALLVCRDATGHRSLFSKAWAVQASIP